MITTGGLARMLGQGEAACLVKILPQSGILSKHRCRGFNQSFTGQIPRQGVE
jgi:hypothetical protein